MGTTTMIHVRLDEQVKQEASEALEAMGLSVSDAVRALLVRVAAEKALPFALHVPNAPTPEADEMPRAGGGGKKTTLSLTEKTTRHAGVPTKKKSSKPPRAATVETIEARLKRKATAADTQSFATDSLGQMTREMRHKLLYGD